MLETALAEPAMLFDLNAAFFNGSRTERGPLLRWLLAWAPGFRSKGLPSACT